MHTWGECDEWAGLFGLTAGDGLFLTVSDDLGFSFTDTECTLW